MRLRNLLLLLCLVPAAHAGLLVLTSPLSLDLTAGALSGAVTGGPSDLFVFQQVADSSDSGWFAAAVLELPGTYNAGLVQAPSPLGFRLTDVSVYCTRVGGCNGNLDINFSFAFLIDSGFAELAGKTMDSSISYGGLMMSTAPHAAAGSLTFLGSFTNSLAVASSYVRSFALSGIAFGNATIGSVFTNAGAGSFGPSGNLGSVGVNGTIRLTGMDQTNSLHLDSVDYTFVPTAVPEPGAAALVLGGIGACFWLARRRRMPATAPRRSSLRPAGPVFLGAAPDHRGRLAGNDAAPAVPRS